jgi:1-acyl-sn-glycerol-3-phosphate acyltransferase
VIFPEGTRTLDGELQPLQPGIALIARKCGVPIVPVAIQGSFDAWPNGSSIFHAHPIRIMFGKPLEIENLKPAEILVELDKTLRSLIAQLRAGPTSPRL